MALPVNDDFANCDLSAQELETIAAGWPNWVHSALHAVERGVTSFVNNPVGAAVVKDAVIVGVLVAGHIIFR
jgi:hypothetical protein